ncbi:MAG: DUF748 domain-containing protein [Bacteroidales bacterium]|nr:DUF748 domain-containing protein [Bacteroidales bacterium]
MSELEEKNEIQKVAAAEENVQPQAQVATPQEEVAASVETALDASEEVKNIKPKKKRKPLRKALKITLFILGFLVLLFFAITIFISPVAHWYIEKHSKDLCGRVVTMDDLKVNILKGTAEIKGLVGLEKNDKDTCLAFDRLYVDISLWKLLKKTVQLNEITLEKPTVVVVQYPGRFNFTDIAEFYEDDEPDDDEPSQWIVDLRNITLSSGRAIYRDASVGSKFDLRKLSVNIPQIYFSTEQTDFGLDLQFANGGGLKAKLLYGMESSDYDLSLKLTNFELNSITPYLQQFLNIQDFVGRLTTDLHVKGNVSHILDVVASGNVKCSNLAMTDSSGSRVAAIGSVDLGIAEANTKTGEYHLSRCNVAGLDFDYEVFADHTNFDGLFKEDDTKEVSDSTAVKDTASTNSTPSKWHLLIDDLSVTNSSMDYICHTMIQKVQIPVTNIDIHSKNFDLDAPIALKVKAKVGETGELMADWSGSLSDFSNMKLNAFLTNFPLQLASPYCVEYLAYPLEDGVLSFVSVNELVNDNISSQNKVDIYNCTVGKKMKELKPEFNIPLRAGVYVLTDRKGNIQLDLPVSGNISDPTFSYKKIIFKTIGNLLVKVVASPIDFLIKAIGGEPDLFADITYDIYPQGLGSESSDKLNKIAAAMKEKSEIKLTIQQSVDIEENLREYALFNAKRDFYIQEHPGKSLTLEDFTSIQELKITNQKFVSYVNGRAAGVSGDIYAKCLSLYDNNTLRQQIDANIERRNQQIVNHLVSQGVSASRLTVLPLGNKHTPKGKTLVAFDVKVDEEE